MKTEIINCDQCGNLFTKLSKHIKYNQKLKQKNFCSKTCLTASRKNGAEVICLNCGISFYKLKNQIEKRELHFCSSSCSAIYHNNLRKENDYYTSEKFLESIIKTSKTLKEKYSSGELIPNKRATKRLKIYNKTKRKKHSDVTLICKICKKEYTIPFCKRTNKTCGNLDCKIEASVGCRTYPNGKRKLSWYFNKYQNKKVLLESSWEVELAEFLDNNTIEWIRPKFIKWQDSQGTTRRYFPDFYLPKQNLYLDPKNPYAMSMGNTKEKMIAIANKVNIWYGQLEELKNKIKSLE